MNRLAVTLVAMVFALAASLGAAACAPDYSGNFQGTWNVAGVLDSSGSDLSASIEQLSSLNKQMSLTLAEDKTVNFDMAEGQSLSGTWKATSENEVVISFEGYADTCGTLSDGKLVFTEGEQTMTCEKRS